MLSRPITRVLARPLTRPITGSSGSLPPEPGVPTHSQLPILGTAARKPVWFDNDEEDDTYTTEAVIAAHIAGSINLIGFSSTAATSAYGSNPTLNDTYFNQDMVDRASIITEMGQSGWDMSTVPAIQAPFKGAFGAIGTPVESTARVTGYSGSGTRTGHNATSDFIAAVHAYSTPGQPFIVLCGGQLTLVADAYLVDNSIAAKCVILFVAGDQSIHPGGFYNEWADATASRIVHEKFTMVNFPATYPNVTQAVVTKANLLARLPDSPLRSHMQAKARTGNLLPADMDGDGNPLLCLLDPSFVRAVSRQRSSGTQTKNNGSDRTVSGLVNAADGEIYLCDVRQMGTGGATTSGSPNITMVDNQLFIGQSVTGPGIQSGSVIIATDGSTTATLSKNATATASGLTFMLNSKTGTDTWWSNIARPTLWTRGKVYQFNPTVIDNFDRANASDLGAGWAACGTLARNGIVGNQAAKATTGYAFDIRTDDYPADQYVQMTFASTPAASFFPAISARSSIAGPSAVTGYYVYPVGTTTTNLQGTVGTTNTNLLTGMPGMMAGDIWRLCAVGNLLTVWRKRGYETEGIISGGFKLVGVRQNADTATGKPAMLNSRSAGPSVYSDDFEAGNISF